MDARARLQLGTGLLRKCFLNGYSWWAWLLLLAACGASASPARINPTLTPAVTTPQQTDRLTDRISTPVAIASPTVIPSGPREPITLTLWVPEEFAPGAEQGGDVLQKQLDQFHAAYPNIRIKFILKAPYGKGGVVDWLRQLRELVPERLPDMAVVDSRELDELERLELLQPLAHDLPAGMFWDLMPPAQKIAAPDGKWNNVPLVLDLEHLVFDSQRIQTPPATWDQVLATKARLAFAAQSLESFLFHYLENGGRVTTDQQPAQEASIMEAVLTFYQRAQVADILPESAAAIKSARDVFPLFAGGQVPMAVVYARDFRSEQARLPQARVAPIPTRDGRATALVSAWSYVILTADPSRHAAAARWLAWVDEATHLAEWSASARLIPARASAFAAAVMPEDYAASLYPLIRDGMVAPSFAEQAPYAKVWAEAVEAVLGGGLAPADAATRAASAMVR